MVKLFMCRIVAILALLLCAGCATLYNPATEKKEFIFINSSMETAIGKNVVGQLLSEHPESKDVNIQERVKAVGNRVAAVSERKDIAYTFSVIDDKELNAMALPGGFIYINKGLVEILTNDELAFVLGHEIGHVAARHLAKKMQANIGYQLLLALAFSVGSQTDAANAKTVAQSADAVYNLVQLGYSRKDELEADRLGVRYSLSAGYDPRAGISALEKLKKESGQGANVPSYLRTHPYIEERVAALKVAIPQAMLRAKNSQLTHKE
ncbi:MAG: M48 family metallopeptidase [Candidatus Omnitrophota bacterium]